MKEAWRPEPSGTFKFQFSCWQRHLLGISQTLLRDQASDLLERSKFNLEMFLEENSILAFMLVGGAVKQTIM